jgi:hypothetical protein
MKRYVCVCIAQISRLCCVVLLIAILGARVHGQCKAPAGTNPPAAPTLKTPVIAGAATITGTAASGNMVLLCVDGNPTNPPSTATVASDGTFSVPMTTPLEVGQHVAVQQFTPGGTPVYSALSPATTVIFEEDICLETLQSGGCQFRIQIDTSGAVGNGSQTNTSTTPNLLVTLDYQWKSPKNPTIFARVNGRDPGKVEQHLAIHLNGKTGYTQTFAASSVQPTSTNGGSTPACPSNSQSTSSTNCMLAISKPSFIGQLGGKFGATTGVDNEGYYGEFGVSGQGSFQYLIPTNQIVQNNGATYIDLNATNPHNVVGFYEIAGYAQVAQHDHTIQGGSTENSSPLLVIEGGYQNNRGLSQLLPASSQSTRNRYVGRFSFNYEVPGTKHSKISFGMEYSGGLNGGPHVVQLFIGGNLNPAKLFKNGS